jgi:uncharacterized membrane protein YhdT
MKVKFLCLLNHQSQYCPSLLEYYRQKHYTRKEYKMDYTFVITVWTIFAVGCAFAGEKKDGLPLSWFILGCIFGPLAFIVALTGRKRCHHCLSIIPKDAKVCRYCSKES